MVATILTENFVEASNQATAARIEIQAGYANLYIDPLTGAGETLASGALQRLEGQEPPERILDARDGQATLTVKSGRGSRPHFRLPWQACVAATEWRVQLHPQIITNLTAHTDGGNVQLNLQGMRITRLVSDSGGGNMNVTLPDHSADLQVDARSGGGNVTIQVGVGMAGSNRLEAGSGAGNVTVSLPMGLAARIHASTGLGKVTVSPQFAQTAKDAYQSPDYESAANKIEIVVKSGAGNVSVLAQ